MGVELLKLPANSAFQILFEGKYIDAKDLEDSYTVRFFDTEETQWYTKDLAQLTIENKNYRQVIKTSPNHQIVLMSIDKEIGMEVHSDTDQFIRVEQGEGKAIIDGKEYVLTDNSAINVAQGSYHNIINTSSKPLKLYTIYSPPHHAPGLIEQYRLEE